MFEEEEKQERSHRGMKLGGDYLEKCEWTASMQAGISLPGEDRAKRQTEKS